MMREMLRAKVHRVTVTECDLEYEGSLTLDPVLMQACGMVPYERIHVWNVANGNRFSTYLIEGEPGKGECCVNGSAAHKVSVGEKLIIAAFCSLDESEIADHEPRVVLTDERNKPKVVKRYEKAGVRVP